MSKKNKRSADIRRDSIGGGVMIDNCKKCPVPDDPRYYDPESELYFTCADCACLGCEYLHRCDGQCADRGDR